MKKTIYLAPTVEQFEVKVEANFMSVTDNATQNSLSVKGWSDEDVAW